MTKTDTTIKETTKTGSSPLPNLSRTRLHLHFRYSFSA